MSDVDSLPKVAVILGAGANKHLEGIGDPKPDMGWDPPLAPDFLRLSRSESAWMLNSRSSNSHGFPEAAPVAGDIEGARGNISTQRYRSNRNDARRQAPKPEIPQPIERTPHQYR